MNKRNAALVAILLLATGCEQTIKFQSGSMAPTIAAGERVAVDAHAYRTRDPARWDIVVFEPPNREILDIKRVVGLPGETLTLESGRVLIDGKPVEQPDRIRGIVYAPLGPNRPTQRQMSYEIPAGSYFLLGDSPEKSLDSRVFGNVAENRIRLKVVDR